MSTTRPHRMPNTAGWLRLALAGLMLVGLPLPTAARATAQDASAAPAVGAQQPSVAAERRSARATMRTFLAAMDDVAEGREARVTDGAACLDLSEINEIIREERGGELAIDLKEVIDRLEQVMLQFIPDNGEAPPYEWASTPEGRIVLARQADGEWLFTTETVAAIPDMLAAVEGRERVSGKAIVHPTLSSKWLRQRMPEGMRSRAFLLEHWQWLGLLLLTFLGTVVDRLFILLLGLTTGRFLRREHLHVESGTMRASFRPFGLLAMALVWAWGLSRLGLPDEVYVWLKVAVEFIVALAGVWGAYRLVDVAGEALASWAENTDSTLDDLLVPLLVKTLKVFVFVMGTVFLADKLKLNIAGLLTGLGIGGLAFALAAQDMVKNLFGSLMVIFDRTFQVGDWVVVGDVEGTIEKLGFRSTRVRTFYNSVITLPNSQLITASVDNLGARRFRRWKAMLSLTYDTPPERIEAFCEGVRELIRRHPYTRKDYFQVYLNGFAAASLDVLVYAFHECPDWSTELRERHRLMLDILRLAKGVGVDFAFPTQTLHVIQGEGGQLEPGEWAASTEVNQANMRGRKAARDIVNAFGLDNEAKPPPVRFDVPREADRGESGDGEG